MPDATDQTMSAVLKKLKVKLEHKESHKFRHMHGLHWFTLPTLILVIGSVNL